MLTLALVIYQSLTRFVFPCFHSVWDGFIARSAASWELLATIWIRGLKRGGVIYYERLRSNIAEELVRIAKMLGIRHINQERLSCVLRHNKHNTFKRQGDKPNYSA